MVVYAILIFTIQREIRDLQNAQFTDELKSALRQIPQRTEHTLNVHLEGKRFNSRTKPH